MTSSRENARTSVTRRLIITGRVQGVGFRAFVHRHAAKLGLDGFVRNCEDGSVEVLASGEKETADRLVALCRRGPATSRVDHMEVMEASDSPEPGFRHL